MLTKLFDVWGSVLDSLIKQGQWTVLESVLGMLQDTEAIRPDLPAEQYRETAGRRIVGWAQSTRTAEADRALPESHAEGADRRPRRALLLEHEGDGPALCGLLANLNIRRTRRSS
ncbi:MAG: hypothetical protein U0231_12695 [Nitrospiraceae bacterium]